MALPVAVRVAVDAPLASIGLADPSDKTPPASPPVSDVQNSVDYPAPPRPKPAFAPAPLFDENGAPLAPPPEGAMVPTRPEPELDYGQRVLDAAWEGAKEGWGPGRLGFSPESEQSLRDTGFYNQPGQANPLRTLNEAVMTPLVGTADAIIRGGNALFRGAQAAGVAAGLPRDIVAMPEAFLGSPHPVGIPRAPIPVPAPETALRDIAERGAAEAPRPEDAPPPPAISPAAGEAETSSPRLQAPGGKGSGSLSFYDRLDDFKRFREEKGLDGTTPLDHNDAARQYVIERQGDETAEHIAIYDANANAVTHAGTSLDEDEVALPAEVDAKIRDPSERITIHHSHGGSGGLSPDDLQLTSSPGTAWVVAHDEGGELSAARLTPEARTALRIDDEFRQKRAQKIIADLWNRADKASRRVMNQAVDRGEFTEEEGDRISTEIVNRALADAGVIEYLTSHSLPSHPVIDRMRALASSALNAGTRSKIPELATMYLIRRPNRWASTKEWQEFLARMMKLPQDEPNVQAAVEYAQDELDLRSGRATEDDLEARSQARLDESFRLLREAQAAERKMKKGE